MRPPSASALAVRRSVAAAVCLPLLAGPALTGCSGEDQPEPIIDSQAATKDPTPTESPSVSPTAQPWEKRTKAGAVAFVKHWMDSFNEATSTGSTRTFESLSSPLCETCRNLRETIESLYGTGGSISSDGWKVVEVALPEGRLQDPPVGLVQVARSAQLVSMGNGTKKRYAASRALYQVELDWLKDAWKLRELSVAP